MGKQYVLMEIPPQFNISDGDLAGAALVGVSKEGFRVIAETSKAHIIDGEVKFHGDDGENEGENNCLVQFVSGTKHLYKCKPLSVAEMINALNEGKRLLEIQSMINHFKAQAPKRPSQPPPQGRGGGGIILPGN